MAELEVSNMPLQFWNTVILGFTALILFAIAIIYWMGTKQAARKSTWEATHEIYKEWWSDELNELRRYFYEDFLPIYKSKKNELTGKGMKEIETPFAKAKQNTASPDR